MTISPKNISYYIIFLRHQKGSISAVIKVTVDMVANATDTLETLMAAKNVTQSNAITTPATIKVSSILPDIFKENLLIAIKTKISTAAISMRYQTNGSASRVINFPKTAVNPHIKKIM